MQSIASLATVMLRVIISTVLLAATLSQASGETVLAIDTSNAITNTCHN